jgi:hypothetical protein
MTRSGGEIRPDAFPLRHTGERVSGSRAAAEGMWSGEETVSPGGEGVVRFAICDLRIEGASRA